MAGGEKNKHRYCYANKRPNKCNITDKKSDNRGLTGNVVLQIKTADGIAPLHEDCTT